MSVLLCLALLGQTLVPSPELAAKLEELEARRPALETRRSQAWGLRISAFVVYGLSLFAAGWAAAEYIALNDRRIPEPLTGTKYQPVVPIPVMAVTALGLLATGAVLHIAAAVMDLETRNRELDLADEARLWRLKLQPPAREEVPPG